MILVLHFLTNDGLCICLLLKHKFVFQNWLTSHLVAIIELGINGGLDGRFVEFPGIHIS